MELFQEDLQFKKNFIISLGLHTLFLALSLLGGKIVSSVFRNNDVEIIKSAVRVDVVGMPKFTVKELREMQKNVPSPKVETPKSVEGSTKVENKEIADVVKKDDLVIQEVSKEKNKKSFLNLISDYSSKKLVDKEQIKGQKTGDQRHSLDSLVIEGNRLSKGTALVGDYSEDENSEFASYVQGLPDIIRKFWKLPSYLLDKELRCRIKIYLSSNGKLVKLEVQEPSGQAEFDARAEGAIRSAAPYFPAPVESVSARLGSSGIILGFPL